MLKRYTHGLLLPLSICACVLFCSILSGCVAYQTIALDYSPSPHDKIISSHTIKSDVVDARPYVKSGEKKDRYIGHYRGGYGNTWDVLLQGSNSLAKQLALDILEELKACGFQTSPLKGDRALKVDIIEFNFDTFLNGKFWYDIRVSVLDPQNNTLASSTLKDEHVIKGSVLVGPVIAFPKELPKLYDNIVEKIVRDNPAILNALK